MRKDLDDSNFSDWLVSKDQLGIKKNTFKFSTPSFGNENTKGWFKAIDLLGATKIIRKNFYLEFDLEETPGYQNSDEEQLLKLSDRPTL